MVDQGLTRQQREVAVHGPRGPAALETLGLYKSFGALRVAARINFRLQRGARHALIGPNGAGKTTFINLLTGVLRADRRARCCSTAATSPRVAQAERVKLGIARTFQINRLFRGLSVLENVYIAVAERLGAAPLDAAARPASART